MISLLLEQLSATREQLLKEIAIYNDTQFNQKPDADSWSIAQICHHLVLVEASTIKAIAWALSSQENTNPERQNVQQIKDRTRKLTAPKIVEPASTPFEKHEILTLLADTRKQFTAFLHGIEDPSLLAKKAVNHPAIGKLPLDQWIEQVYLHEQRHFEQIHEMKQIVG
ncbi:DinB family protein [Lysinibacillus sp. CD3-6]|uniref:DinB family protein n=1 Tax=Lysinibacillus sp. CD3-6 TaxID=2892541 RepID=UPI00155E8755|nr:DinB family protein [Lysinibacillus sp. CD3-6]UED78164.1 DinB family protein [Lysinibacillus sp. CD3-6]